MELEADGSETAPASMRLSTLAGRIRGAVRVLPMGLIGFLPILWLIEGHIAGRQDMSTLPALEWKRVDRLVRSREAVESPLLCFGSSLTRFGVAPRVIEENLHLPAYNLAIAGGQPFSSCLTPRHALAAGARPRAIVVDFMWMTAALHHSASERLLVEIVSLAECAEFGRATGDLDSFGRLTLAKVLPSARARLEVRANIDHALRGSEPPRVPERALHDIHAFRNRGGVLMTPAKYEWRYDPDSPMIFPKPWSCTAISKRYIHEFLSLAESRAIPVLWLLPPLAPVTKARLAEIGIEREYLRFVESVRVMHPGVTIVDGSRSNYDDSAFCDVLHLNRDGAIVWSAQVAAAIDRRLAATDTVAGVWERVPDYRPDPQPDRFEDTEETQALLMALRSRLVR